MLEAIDGEVRRCDIPREAVQVRPRFQGRHGILVPDRAVYTGKGTAALHAISFACSIYAALQAAKVLAVDFEDARARTGDLKCTAVLDPAPGDSARGQEAYEEAAGHLKDRDYRVV